MKFHRAVLAIVCTLLLAGCLPVTSKTPVGTTVGLGNDEALFGTWKGTSGDDHMLVYLHFLRPKPDGATPAVMVVPGTEKDEGSVGFYELRTAKLGDNRFINLLKIYDNDKAGDLTSTDLKDGSVPILYRFAKNRTLTLYLLDEDKTKEAIQAGLIAGTVEPGASGDVKITADASALDTFMATPEAAKLFKVFLVLKKVE